MPNQKIYSIISRQTNLKYLELCKGPPIMHLRLHPVVSAKGFIKRIYQVISLYLMYMTRTISTLDSPQDCFCFISESFQDYKSLCRVLRFLFSFT